MLVNLVYLIKVLWYVLLGALMLKFIIEVCIINTTNKIKGVFFQKKLASMIDEAIDEAIEELLNEKKTKKMKNNSFSFIFVLTNDKLCVIL